MVISMNKLYLQMYSFGDFDPSQTEKNIKLASEMGYSGVELFGPNFAMDAESMNKLLVENNITAVSLHAETDNIINLIPYAKTLGLRYMGIGMQYLPDAATAEAYAKQLNEIGAVCHQEGIVLTYHNHTQEFMDCGQKKLLEILMDNTNPECVGFELDAGWCAAAGFDPIAFIKKHDGRIKLVHVKESKEVIGVQPAWKNEDIFDIASGTPVMKDDFKQMFARSQEINCPAGEGLVDWKELKMVADQCGCEAYIVEREYSYSGSRVDCLKADIEYYQKNM